MAQQSPATYCLSDTSAAANNDSDHPGIMRVSESSCSPSSGQCRSNQKRGRKKDASVNICISRERTTPTQYTVSDSGRESLWHAIFPVLSFRFLFILNALFFIYLCLLTHLLNSFHFIIIHVWESRVCRQSLYMSDFKCEPVEEWEREGYLERITLSVRTKLGRIHLFFLLTLIWTADILSADKPGGGRWHLSPRPRIESNWVLMK